MNPLLPFSLLLLAACAAPSAGLAGKWRVQEAGSAAVAGRITIEFQQDGLFVVDGGCNHASGRYRQSGGRLSMSAGFTEKACAAPLMRLDDRLAAAVRQTVSYRISGTQLEWLDENGNTVLKARRAENADKQAVAD